jgi:pimeloyl-ACP methyl ester carboxylesterase
MFCLYAYFRLINPYLDVGLPVEKASEDVFNRHSVEIYGDTYSYWTNNVLNPRKTVVMLPPSTAMGDHFGKFAQIFPGDVLIIAPDYPGRGLTDSIPAFDTAPLIANRVAILLKELLGDKSFDVVAPSFGGMIGTRLVKDSDLNINQIFLIATGEFFGSDQKIMYKALFHPAKTSERIRSNYVSLVTGLGIFTEWQGSNIEEILEQWLMTIDYEIDTTQTSPVPAVIVIFTQDNVIRPGSDVKLQKVFVNSRTVNADLKHTSENFFSPEIVEILLSGI